MRLIDADALIGELHTTYLYDDNARKVIYRKIEEQPTIAANTNEKEQWFEDWGLTPETASQVLHNYSAFLCSMTGGKLSKIGYDLKTMESVANDYWNMLIDEGITEYKMSNGGKLK